MASYEIQGSQSGPDAPTDGEGLLAGKYNSQEELEKGTLELLKKQGSLEDFYKNLESGKINPSADWTQQPQQEEQPGQTGKETEQQEQQPNEQAGGEESRDEAKNVLEQNGLNLEDFEQEFAQNGELSDESYAKLQEFFPKSMVDNYIAGQQALAERSTSELLNEAGGEEAYQSMVQWASENLSEQEINYFNEAVQSGDMVKAKWAVNALTSQYQRATGAGQQRSTKPGLISGQNPSQGSVSGYQSKQEMIRDMQDPKYTNDPAFRTQVEEKLKRTTVF